MDEGTQRSFDASYETVQQAVVEGLRLLKLAPTARSDTPEGHIIMIARPPHGFSWGEVGRILVVRSEAKPTTVRVVYEKRLTMQVVGSEAQFARNLFAKMDQVLASPAPSAAAR